MYFSSIFHILHYANNKRVLKLCSSLPKTKQHLMFSCSPGIYWITLKILNSRNPNAEFLNIFSFTYLIIFKFKFLEKQSKPPDLHTVLFFLLLINTILITV